jgi:carbon storage regulator
MLVLSRRVNGRILIGDDIEITVVEIRGDKIRLGIVAPKSIAVDREEVRKSKVASGQLGK